MAAEQLVRVGGGIDLNFELLRRLGLGAGVAAARVEVRGSRACLPFIGGGSGESRARTPTNGRAAAQQTPRRIRRRRTEMRWGPLVSGYGSGETAWQTARVRLTGGVKRTLGCERTDHKI